MATPRRLELVPSPERAERVRRAARPGARRRVALVCMPFQQVELPSLALGTLAEILRREGHEVDVLHLNLDFAVRIGLGRYEEIVSYPGWLRLYGEWLFGDWIVAPGAASRAEYVEYLRAHRWRERARAIERLDHERLGAEADRSVDRWSGSRDWGAYDVVGFSVMFQQTNASLRLAARIKSRWPSVRVVLGGSAVQVPMGQPILDRYPWLDAVFSGYAERTFPEYVAALPERQNRVITQAEPTEMDDLPIPDFDAFFSAARSIGLNRAADLCVPIETSRGCWWGEKQHCIFCGLNALDMKQRNKSTDRVFAEVVAQSRHRHPFFATDNILPLEFFDDLFIRLIDARVPFDTFYETKANLGLKQLKTLRRAGVNCIQPGIESLSTPILRYMKKGVSSAQNLWILRAAEEQGLGIAWSILYGFPDEDPAEYQKMAALLPSLSHLPPPLRPAPVLLERYSPLFDRGDDYRLRNVRPTAAHEKAFGKTPGLGDRAYTFDFEYGDARDPDTYTHELNDGVAAWIAARRGLLSPRCEVFCFGSMRIVFDTRGARQPGRGLPRLYVLSDAEWHLVRLTEELTTLGKLKDAWSRSESVDTLIDAFVERRWLIRADGRLVRILMCREEPTVHAELRRAARGGLRRARRATARVATAIRARVAALCGTILA